MGTRVPPGRRTTTWRMRRGGCTSAAGPTHGRWRAGRWSSSERGDGPRRPAW